MTTRRIAAAVLALGLIAGCGGDDDNGDENPPDSAAAPSAECVDLFRQADATNNEDIYGPLFDESLTVCETVDQWIAGLKEHPGAIGVKGPEFVDPSIDLGSVCASDTEGTPVCAEAIADGIIPAP